MNVPTHYNTMSDSDVLRDLFARGYNDDPLVEHVCQRWELLVDEVEELKTDLVNMQDAMAEEAVQAEQKQDAMQKEIDSLEKGLDMLERETSRWESKTDELQMEVENLSAQLVFAQRILGED